MARNATEKMVIILEFLMILNMPSCIGLQYWNDNGDDKFKLYHKLKTSK